MPGTQSANHREDEAAALMLGRRTSDDERVPRKDRTGASPFVVASWSLVVACIGVFFGFTKHIPFTHGFRVKAVFQSANSIRENSPVRIAGVNVGKVTKIEGKPGSDAAVVTMEINGKGLPIHKDAVMKIRPRIFLEGNFFVDVSPGTPSAPDHRRRRHHPADPDRDPGAVRPGAEHVPERHADVAAEDARGPRNGPDLQAAEGAGPRRRTRAPGARARGQSLNDAIRYGERSLRGTAIVADAFLGTEDHDLSRLIAGLNRTTEGLGRNEEQLKGLVTNFNRTVAATASRGGQPARLDPPARADARRTPTAPWTR